MFPPCRGGGGHDWIHSYQPCDRTFCGGHNTVVCEECHLSYDEQDEPVQYRTALDRIRDGLDTQQD